MQKYKKQEIDFPNIIKFFNRAVKKSVNAKKILTFNEEAAYQAAYEAMLKASLALMLSYGFRPRSLPGHHVVIIEFSSQKLGKGYRRLIDTFDQMRRKRKGNL